MAKTATLARFGAGPRCRVRGCRRVRESWLTRDAVVLGAGVVRWAYVGRTNLPQQRRNVKRVPQGGWSNGFGGSGNMQDRVNLHPDLGYAPLPPRLFLSSGICFIDERQKPLLERMSQ